MEKVATVGALAVRFGVSTETVRRWERKAGITTAREESGGRRLFTTKDIKAIEAWRGERNEDKK